MTEPHWIQQHGLIAILRISYLDGTLSSHLFPLVDALYEGGIRILEVTMNSPNAVEMVSALARRYGDRLWIGRGLC